MNSKVSEQTKDIESSRKALQGFLSLTACIENREDLQQILAMGMNELTVQIVLCAMKAFIDAEIASRCGQLYQRTPSFDCYRHGKQKTGYVIINGQKHQMKKPRIVKRGNSKQEVTIEAYRDFQKNAEMEASVLAKMLHGVSTRDYEAVIEAVQDAYGVRRSSVSRHFVRASAEALRKFDERPIDRYFPIIFVDGYEVGGEVMLVALGVDENGVKMALSMRQGGTENGEVAKSMFEDMKRRGLRTDRPILVVIDGSKALHSAITACFTNVFIQRCREHKKRNILDHAPVSQRGEVEKRIQEAYADLNYDTAYPKMRALASWASSINPDMGKSVFEGLDETLTVVRLGVTPLLYKSLYSTNPIESLNSSLENFAHRVKSWKNGDMRKRWLASAIMQSEERMHRIRGFMGIRALVANMEKLLEEKRMIDARAS